MKLDSDNKKMLIRSDQTESTKGKNVVVDDSVAPRMIKPKNPEVGLWKVNARRRQAPRPKPIVSMFLEKYTSCKADNVFNRLGGIKRPRYPSRPTSHGRRQGNSYDRRPYFAMDLTYGGCAPPIYPHFPSWGFNPWAPYPTRPACYFQPDWIPAGPMYRKSLLEKGIRFNQEVRPRDANVIRGNDERLVLGTSNSRRRHNANGIVHRGGKKFVWVPVRRVESNSIKSSDDLDVSNALKLGEHQSAASVENRP
jgi:hypothetical protein